MWQNMVETEGPHTSQIGAYALRAGLAHAHVHAPGYSHARTHAHAITHRPISNTYRFSTASKIRQVAPMLRYTDMVFLFCNFCDILTFINEIIYSRFL